MGYDQTYPLYVGLHAYTSGLERLAKLTIACHGFVSDGSFPPLKRFGHRVGGLLDAVDGLDFNKVKDLPRRPLERPMTSLDPLLTDVLERFANGAGRYEHLDSLSDAASAVETHQKWSDLCTRATVSDHVRYILSMRTALIRALRDLCTAGEIESSTFSLLAQADQPLFDASVGVALQLFEKASWVASVLDALTYYTHEELPILGEAVQPLQTEADKFFQYSVALIEDEYVVDEELQEHFERFPEIVDDDFEV